MAFPVNYIGHLSDDITCGPYSASDLVVTLSCKIISHIGLEAHACGSPVVAFNVGGSLTLLSRKTGALAQPFVAESLQIESSGS